MDKVHYEEMMENLAHLMQNNVFQGRDIYVFGHCNASEELVKLLIKNDCKVKAILDNNTFKQGTAYKGIPIVSPEEVKRGNMDRAIVCIVARAYASMAEQLRQMGYTGMVKKLVEYDSYAEYSLAETVILQKQERVERGIRLLEGARGKYPGCYRIYCPFSALGDVYYMMSYLPHFLKKREVSKYTVFTIGITCAEVAEMFGAEYVEALSQKDMDESIQAVLYTGDENAYIPHQDRPYVVNLAKALYVKRIPLEMIYKCGVFGLDQSCMPYKPVKLKKYEHLEQVIRGKAVVLSPYAKSVTNISSKYWKQIVRYYEQREYQIFTNVTDEEQTLEGTIPLTVKLSELQSVVETAGTFVGIRSGLCDVIKEASCKKIALYPDCCYSDTRWKMEEIYHLDGFENIVIR